MLQPPLSFSMWPAYSMSMQCVCADASGAEHVLLHELRAVTIH